MQKKTRSILEELESMHQTRDTHHVVESRARNIITSAINLIETIETNYSESEANDLTRKLLNSIKNKDYQKFSRSLGRIDENKTKKTN